MNIPGQVYLVNRGKKLHETEVTNHQTGGKQTEGDQREKE